MYGFQVDFVQNGSTYMVLERSEGIRNEDLRQVEVKMMGSTPIPHLLPLDIHELDLRIRFQYNIAGKRMLSQLLRTEKLSLQQFYALLLQLLSALDDSRFYMLRPHHYLLHPDFIFVDGSLQSGTLWFCYVPMQESFRQEPLQQQISMIVTNLVTSISELNGSGLQQIVQYCQDGSFNLPGLKTMLIQLLSGKQEAIGDEVNNMPASSQNNLYDNSYPLPLTRIQQQPRELKGYTEQEPGLSSLSVQRQQQSLPSYQAIMQPVAEENGDEDHSSTPRKIYVPLVAVIVTILLWRFLYMDNASIEGMLYVCVGATLLIGDGVFLWWRGVMFAEQMLDRRGKTASESPHYESGELAATGHLNRLFGIPAFEAEKLVTGPQEQMKRRRGLANNKEPDAARHPGGTLAARYAESSNVPGAVHHEQSSAIAANTGYAKPFQPTDMLSGGCQATVALTADPAREHGVQAVTPKPYLERRLPEGTEEAVRIELNTPHFIIGRTEGVAHYVDLSVGVSRTHVEITQTANGFEIKDIGSKNGTLLQQEPMVPYKAYPLADGYQFKIANAEYTFRTR